MAGIPDIGNDGYIAAVIAQYPALEDLQDILTQARAVHLALRAIDLNTIHPEDLAGQPNPHNLFWPTHVAKPQPANEDQTRFFGPDATHFTYMSRPTFATLVTHLATRRRRMYFLYGPQGVGKSHLLAAAALLFSVRYARVVPAIPAAGGVGAPIIQLAPVCYIPDMKEALEFKDYFFNCLVQCFITQPAKLAKLAELRERESAIVSLVSWARDQRGVIYIADQCNEVGNTTLPKDQALDEFVHGINTTCWLIYAASANQNKVKVFYSGSGGDNVECILVPKFSFAEYCAFVTANFHALAEFLVVPQEPQDAVVENPPSIVRRTKEITGFVPLQVYNLCVGLTEILLPLLAVRAVPLPQPGEFGPLPPDQQTFQIAIHGYLDTFSSIISMDVTDKVKARFAQKQQEGNLEWEVQQMSLAANCLTRCRNQQFITQFVDWRFFYPEGQGMVAKPVSEVARAAVVAQTIAASDSLSIDKKKRLLSQLSGALNVNPSVRGFILEAIVNGCLTFCSWRSFNVFVRSVPAGQVPPPHVFQGWPEKANGNVHYFDKGGFKCQGAQFSPTLLIPTVWNNRKVDAVIVYQHNGHAYVIGIQVTIQTPAEHGHSMTFVSDGLEHMKFVPEAYHNLGQFTIALLWVVPKAHIGIRAGARPGNIQGAVPLEFFQDQSGITLV